jgi:hypothetical protein
LKDSYGRLTISNYLTSSGVKEEKEILKNMVKENAIK